MQIQIPQVLASRRAGDLRTFVRVSGLVTNVDCLEAFRRQDGQLSPGHQVINDQVGVQCIVAKSDFASEIFF